MGDAENREERLGVLATFGGGVRARLGGDGLRWVSNGGGAFGVKLNGADMTVSGSFPSYTVTVADSALLQQGKVFSGLTVKVAVDTGSTERLSAFAVTGTLPAGVTATLSPTPVTGVAEATFTLAGTPTASGTSTLGL